VTDNKEHYDMVKVGITGIGGYGRMLLDILLEEQRHGRLQVVAAVVSFPEQDAEHLALLKKASPETRVFSTLDEAASSGVELDWMLLPVSIYAHKELTLKALATGWNVLVEKPLAGSVEEAEAIIAAAEGSPHRVAVGYQDMYSDEVHAMKAVLLRGGIGEVRSVRTAGLWGRSAAYYRRNEWAGRLICDGRAVYDSPFNNGMAHYLNMALFLAGSRMEESAEPVAVCGEMWRAHAIESCDTACLNWRTADGPEVAILFSHAGRDYFGPELVVQGTRGTLRWRWNKSWEVIAPDGSVERHPALHSNDLRRLMLRRVLTPEPGKPAMLFTPHQALAQVRAVALAHATIPIRAVPEEQLRRYRMPDAQGVDQEWVEIEKMQQTQKKFFMTANI